MPFAIGAAILGGTSLLGGIIGAGAAGSAASQQAGAAQNATAAQQGMFNQIMGNLQPYQQAGGGALNSLEYQLGISPGSYYAPSGIPAGSALAPTQTAGAGAATSPQLGSLASQFGVTPQTFGYAPQAPAVRTTGQATPVPGGNVGPGTPPTSGTQGGYGWLSQPFNASDLNANLAPNYQFQLGQGMGQIANEGAATGMSGNTSAGLQSFAQNYAGNAYQQAFQNYTTNQQNIYGRLGNLAQLGEQASTGGASGAPLFASGISQTIQGLGQAQAAGTIGTANAISGGLGGLGSAFALQNLLANQQPPPYEGWV